MDDLEEVLRLVEANAGVLARGWWDLCLRGPLPADMVAHYDARGERVVCWLVAAPDVPSAEVYARSDLTIGEVEQLQPECFFRWLRFMAEGAESGLHSWRRRRDGWWDQILITMDVQAPQATG